MRRKSKIAVFSFLIGLIFLTCGSVFAEEETALLKLTAPERAVCCCTAEVVTYWEAEGAKIRDFATGRRENQCAPAVLSWKCSLPDVKEFQVRYGLLADFSDARTVTVSADKREVKLWNLFRGETYYWRVAAVPTEEKAGNSDVNPTEN
ncbi:MAG: hypothetical protein Q4C70_01535, partial [Planctomycetia bacterium]|nr:hypothetical protein [Planctomycetia bacterium]